jgi:hypothetical protein
MTKFLLVLGLLFIVQAAIMAAMSRPSNMTETKLYLAELDTRGFVLGLLGSLVGCFGSWLFVLNLGLRRVERRLSEVLAGSRTAAIPIGSPPEEGLR